jgi:predicted flavoprotein YhiN
MAGAVLRALSLPADRALADLTRDDRRRLVHAVTGWPLPVLDTRGYNYAEVTAGGVPLAEVDPATMQSRVCPGLYFAGEILDVDGRIGGFNFQWAWCTAALAGRAVSASTPPLPIGN